MYYKNELLNDIAQTVVLACARGRTDSVEITIEELCERQLAGKYHIAFVKDFLENDLCILPGEEKMVEYREWTVVMENGVKKNKLLFECKRLAKPYIIPMEKVLPYYN